MLQRGVLLLNKDGLKNKFAEILVKEGVVLKEELDKAFKYSEKNNVFLEEALYKLGYIPEKMAIEMLSARLNVPFKERKDISIDLDAVALISEENAKRHVCFPFKIDVNFVHVLSKKPYNLLLEDEILNVTGKKTIIYLGLESEIHQLIDEYYVQKSAAVEFASEDDTSGLDYFDLGEDDNSPVIKITNSILKNAIKKNASDIHISLNEHNVEVRYRIDGMLHKVRELPKSSHAALVSRIKTMSNMDIANKRTPQDGRMQIVIDNRKVDMRTSTLPSIHGEKITIRILDTANLFLDLDKFNFEEENKKQLEKLIRLPLGIILITGPTGSGKTSTQYAILNELNDVSKNIVTIEDPVEYKMDGIVQVQVNERANLTFATGLKSILRQDPDIIMIGEIRDRDTAEIAVRASNTGHLVLATLHTNDAISSVTRLLDIGVEPYLVASSLKGVINQRLVRKLCEKCKVSYQSKGFSPVRNFFGIPDDKEITLYKSIGCDECDNVGYKGRIAIQELFYVTRETQRLIAKQASEHELLEEAKKTGLRTLKEDGLEKALKGLTTLEEVMRFILE